MQAALQLSKQSTEDDEAVKTGWITMTDVIILCGVNCIVYIIVVVE